MFDGIHLMCLDEDLLHKFAKSVGLKRKWYQKEDTAHAHYDITTENMSRKVIASGKVVRVESKDNILKIVRIRRIM